MNGTNHALSGLAAYGGSLLVATSSLGMDMPDPVTLGLGSVVAVGAALAADIDEKNSKASQAADGFGWLLRFFAGPHRTRTHYPLVMIPVLSAWCWFLINRAGPGWPFAVTCGLLVAIGWPFATAALLPKRNEKFVAAFSVPAGAALAWYMATRSIEPGWWLYAAIPVPYLAHLVGDTPTPAGIAWLGPFSKSKFSAGLFRSGGTFETKVVTPLLVLACAWFGWQLASGGAFDGIWS